MFDILPNLLSSLLSILFPIFASYKALRTADPAQLSPWLMYWVSFALFTLFEDYTYFVVGWLPLYAYARLFFLGYLVLPQTQGARLLYQNQVHPFLAHHEARIDDLITDTHARLKAAGLDYVRQAIAYVKKTFLGIEEPRPRPPPQSSRSFGGGAVPYAQSLLAQFNLPSARQGLAAPAGDFYGLLSSAVGVLGARGSSSPASRDAQIEELSRSGTLIPANLTSVADRVSFVGQQRERLRVLLGALDREAGELEGQRDASRGGSSGSGSGSGDGGSDGGALKPSKSEASFEKIDREDGGQGGARSAPDGGWFGWAWGKGQEVVKEAASREAEATQGRSSGVDAHRY